MKRNMEQERHGQESIHLKRVANGQAHTRIAHCKGKDSENSLEKIRSAKGKTNFIASHQLPEKQNDEREDPYFCMSDSDIGKIVNRHNTTTLKKKISQISSSCNSSPPRPSSIIDDKDNSFDLVKCLVADKFKDDAVPQNKKIESNSSAESAPSAVFSICKRVNETSLSANKHDLVGKIIQGMKRMEPDAIGKLIASSRKNESVDFNISSEISEETNSRTFFKPSRQLSRVCNNDVLQQSKYSIQHKKTDNLIEINPPPEKEGLHLLHSEDNACQRSSSTKHRCLKCKSQLVHGKDSFCAECKRSGTEFPLLKKVRKQILSLNRSSIPAPKQRAHLAVLEKVNTKTLFPSASEGNVHKSHSLASGKCRFGRDLKEKGQAYKMKKIVSKTDVNYRALTLDTNNGKMCSKTKNEVHFRAKDDTLCNFKIMDIKKSLGRNKKQCQDEPNVSTIRNIVKPQYFSEHCQENVETLRKEKRTKRSKVNFKKALEDNRSKTAGTSHHEMVLDNSRKTTCKSLLDQKRIRRQRKLWNSSAVCYKTEVKMSVSDSTKNPDNRPASELDDKSSHLSESDMITRAADKDESRKTLPSIFGNEEQKCDEHTGAARDDESRCSSNALHCLSSGMYNSSLIDQTSPVSSCKDVLQGAKCFGYKRTASNENQEDLVRKRPRIDKHCVANTVFKPNLCNEQKADGDAFEIHSSDTSIKYPGFLKGHSSDHCAKSVSHIDGRSERSTTDSLCTDIIDGPSERSTTDSLCTDIIDGPSERSTTDSLCTDIIDGRSERSMTDSLCTDIDESVSRCSADAIDVKVDNVEPGNTMGKNDATGCTDSSDLDFQDKFCYKKICDGLYLMSLPDLIDEKNTSHADPNNFTHEKESTYQFPASATKVKIISAECPEIFHIIDGSSERSTTDSLCTDIIDGRSERSMTDSLCTDIDESVSRCSADAIDVKVDNVEPGNTMGKNDATGCTDSSDLDFQDQFCYKKICDGLYLMSLPDLIDEKNTSHADSNNFTHEKESTYQFTASATKVKIISTECPEMFHTPSSGTNTEATFGHKITDSDTIDAPETLEWHRGECYERKREIMTPFVEQEYKLSYKSVGQDITLINLSDEESETCGEVTVEETEMSDSSGRNFELTLMYDKWKTTSPLLGQEHKLSYKPIGQGITLIYLSDEESDTLRDPC